jgi:NADPH-dependent glutamate synthase beta subunit-like oxidoreductase/2,4-dienoyl-CoA reductase-like NADH-dependent reductase (Old Yellow Enzyme family)
MYTKNPRPFKYRTLDEVKAAAAEQGVTLPFTDNVNIKDKIHLFKAPLSIEGVEVPNRFCIQPMEGCDADNEGTPGPLTFRKYLRFAEGGSGMIWMEATAVTPEGRANPRQTMITDKNVGDFKRLADEIRDHAKDENGNPIKPFLILQLTHSGRYSKPTGVAAPMIAHHTPILDPTHNLQPDYPVITDEYLDELQDKFVAAAKLAKEAGYDAVDVKSCHGYLLHELLSTFTRENSRYGGSYENRTRFLKETIAKVKKAVPDIIVTSRLSVYDDYPYPYGFGMATDGSYTPDTSEPIRLVKELNELGVTLINIATGNPYFNPDIERPYDYPIQGFVLPASNPFKTIDLNLKLVKEIKAAIPYMTYVDVGYTWLRNFFPSMAAAVLEQQGADIIGVGRAALAYPDYANILFETGELVPEETCITCSSCTQIMRDGGTAGCVIRDSEVYGPIYRAGRLKNIEYVKSLGEECRNCWGAGCKGGCPADLDIPAFIDAFYVGDIKKAYEIIAEKNILGETCSYTCPVEELCEKKCTLQTQVGTAIPIELIQRTITSEARKLGYTKINAAPATGKKVAVVGYGPAGISVAANLIKHGVKVTVFEASDKPGGIAVSVIPAERLPLGILEEEVRALALEETGLLDLKYNTPINKSFTIDDVLAQGYDAVFIAAGLPKDSRLTNKDLDAMGTGVYSALEFLDDAKLGKFDAKTNNIKRAIVIGGGNTAMDAACSLLACGVQDVYLVYRRSFVELPAWKNEVKHALDKGVLFTILTQPIDYVFEDGKLKAVKVARTELGAPDASGRRSPKIIEGSEYDLEADICIEAIGQGIDPALASDVKNNKDKVYFGGDIVNGGSTVVQAVREGLDISNEILANI